MTQSEETQSDERPCDKVLNHKHASALDVPHKPLSYKLPWFRLAQSATEAQRNRILADELPQLDLQSMTHII